MARDELIIISIISIVAIVGLVPLLSGGQAGAATFYRVVPEFEELSYSGGLQEECDWVPAPGGGSMAVCPGVTYPTQGFDYGSPLEYREHDPVECRNLNDCLAQLGIVQAGDQWVEPEFAEPGKRYYYQAEGGWVEITTG